MVVQGAEGAEGAGVTAAPPVSVAVAVAAPVGAVTASTPVGVTVGTRVMVVGMPVTMPGFWGT
jgi:sensor domain CHASE-containing protein